jgi:hypothetical protein
MFKDDYEVSVCSVSIQNCFLNVTGERSDAHFKNVAHQRIVVFPSKCAKTRLQSNYNIKNFAGLYHAPPIYKGKEGGVEGKGEAGEGRDGRGGKEDEREIGREGRGTGKTPETRGDKKRLSAFYGGG